MRLVTWKIYRAFPELDGYDDEQCRRFIKSARSSPLAALLHAAAMFVTMAVLLAAGIAAVLMLSDRYKALDFSPGSLLTPTGLFFLLSCLLLISAGPLAGYLVRDRLLRRRIAFVLRTRGVCPTCRYSLVGLPLSPRNSVLCPECGIEVEVDASLGELSREGTGRVLVGGIAREANQFWTPARRKGLRRAALAAAILLGVLAPSAGIYELLARGRAARAAAAAVASGDKLNALTTAAPPADGDRNAWVWLGRAVELTNTIDERERSSPSWSGRAPSFDALFRPNPRAAAGGADEFATAESEAQVVARERLAMCSREGLAEIHRGLAGLEEINLPVVRDFPGAPGGFGLAPGGLFEALREQAWLANAQLCEAARRNDPGAFLDALRACLALARMSESVHLYNHAVLGVEIESLTYAHLRWWISSSYARPDLLPEIARILARGQRPVDIPALYDAWRLEHEFFLGRVFSVGSIARWGAFSPLYAKLARTPGSAFYTPGASLGSFEHNMKAVEDLFRAALPDAQKEPSARTGFSPAASFDGLALVSPLRTRLTTALDPFDRLLFERRGIVQLIAIERFRLEHGRAPETLNEILGPDLPSLPRDPWAVQPFRYRALDPLKDSNGRCYVLYSVGRDQRDDGGEGLRADAAFSQGRDLVVNDPWR